jgi:hypothetical protein
VTSRRACRRAYDHRRWDHETRCATVCVAQAPARCATRPGIHAAATPLHELGYAVTRASAANGLDAIGDFLVVLRAAGCAERGLDATSLRANMSEHYTSSIVERFAPR